MHTHFASRKTGAGHATDWQRHYYRKIDILVYHHTKGRYGKTVCR